MWLGFMPRTVRTLLRHTFYIFFLPPSAHVRRWKRCVRFVREVSLDSTATGKAPSEVSDRSSGKVLLAFDPFPASLRFSFRIGDVVTHRQRELACHRVGNAHGKLLLRHRRPASLIA